MLVNMFLQEERKSDDFEGLSRDELGRLVASRWTGENTGHQDNGSDDAKDVEQEPKPEVPKDSQDDDHNGHISETDEDGHRYSDEETDDDTYGEHEYDDPSDSYDSDVEDEADFLGLQSLTLLTVLMESFLFVVLAIMLSYVLNEENQELSFKPQWYGWDSPFTNLSLHLVCPKSCLSDDSSNLNCS